MNVATSERYNKRTYQGLPPLLPPQPSFGGEIKVTKGIIHIFLHCTPTCSVATLLCPTRLVVDLMESGNKGGGVAGVCSSQTGLRFSTLLRDMNARIRTYYVRPNIFGENKKHPPEVRSREGHKCRTCVQKFRSISYKTSWT